MPYRYVVDQVADEALGTLARRDQRRLRDYFRFLAEHPFTRGDDEVTDEDGRVSQIKGWIALWSPTGLTMRAAK